MKSCINIKIDQKYVTQEIYTSSVLFKFNQLKYELHMLKKNNKKIFTLNISEIDQKNCKYYTLYIQIRVLLKYFRLFINFK